MPLGLYMEMRAGPNGCALKTIYGNVGVIFEPIYSICHCLAS